MGEIYLTGMRWTYLVFVLLCNTAGLVAIALAVVYLVDKTVGRIYGLAALAEAARELQAQGRAPHLNRWLRRKHHEARDGQDR